MYYYDCVCVCFSVPQLVFVIVNKKINHRFFLEAPGGAMVNPKPGTVVDSVVTRQERLVTLIN